MKKLFLLLLFSCGMLTIHAQGVTKSQVEAGVQTSVRQTQNGQWHEAFATCRALDEAIGSGSPELHYLVSKERFRMYSHINKPSDTRNQMNMMENYARQSGKSDVIEDMLISKGTYLGKSGRTSEAVNCYKEVFNRRSKGQGDDGVEKCFQTMIAQAKGSKNALMSGILDRMYTQWKDSIASDKAAADYKILQKKYADAQDEISSKATKIGFQWGFIIVLIIIAVGLGVALGFFVLLNVKNMLKIKKLNNSLDIANEGNEQKALFINNIGDQINPALDAIDNGDMKQVGALKKFMQHIKEYMSLENTREEAYEQDDVNMDMLCSHVVNDAKAFVKADMPLKADGHGITFQSNEEALKTLLVDLVKEIARHEDTEKITIEFKKRNPHTANFIVTGTGMTVAEDKRDSLFTAFAEVHDLTVDDGMALPTCSLMAYKLCGDLHLDDEYHHGTRFVVELHS